ncbi:MAG: hypothetical protein WC449_02470 [Candidatus Paceibacterota bacterium]
MKEYHNFLDEYSHDLHGIVELNEIPPVDGITFPKGTHQVSIKGFGMGIKTGDIIVYNPSIGRSIQETDSFSLLIATARVINIDYDTGSSADVFCALTLAQIATSTTLLEMMTSNVILIQKYLVSDGIRCCSWKVSLDLLDDLESKAALRLSLDTSQLSPYSYGHHNPDFT